MFLNFALKGIDLVLSTTLIAYLLSVKKFLLSTEIVNTIGIEVCDGVNLNYRLAIFMFRAQHHDCV